MSPLRVDLLLMSLLPSGQTMHVVELAQGLARAGHEPRVVLAHPAEAAAHHAAYTALLAQQGVTSVAVGHTSALLGTLAAQRADVIHVHDARLFVLIPLLQEWAKCPVVATCHGLGVTRTPFGEGLRRAQTRIAIGPHVQAELEQAGLTAHLLANAVDLNRFQPGVKGEVPVLTYCGRIDGSKIEGIYALAAALDALRQDLVVQVMANRPLPTARAKYLGWVIDSAPFLANSDIVVGTERAIREGMAAGNACLVLGQGYGGVVDPALLGGPETVQWSGRVDVERPVAPRIRADLDGLLGDRDRLRRLQAEGRGYAERHFSSASWIERTLALYRASMAPRA